MKKGQETPVNIAWLVGLIALFLIIYVILIPEGEKEKLITAPEQVGSGATYPTTPGTVPPGPGAVSGSVLLSETPGLLYPYAQQLFVKPFASVNLFSTMEKTEQPLTTSLQLVGGMFAGAEKQYTFRLANPQAVERIRLLFTAQAMRGALTILVNGNEIFSGTLTTDDLPLSIPTSFLGAVNTVTFSVPSGFFSRHSYHLRDVSLFIEERVAHNRELRTFVLSRSQLESMDSLTLFYFVNCFTVNEGGTLLITLNGNLLSQQLVVCDAGEVAQDLPVHELIEGRNILDFSIDTGNFILEQVTLEGNTGQGRVPSYFFTLQQDNVFYGAPVGLDMKFFDDGFRKVATVYLNGFPLYVDTYGDGVFFDITDYVVGGQNVIKIIPTTEIDVVDLSVFLG